MFPKITHPRDYKRNSSRYTDVNSENDSLSHDDDLVPLFPTLTHPRDYKRDLSRYTDVNSENESSSSDDTESKISYLPW